MSGTLRVRVNRSKKIYIRLLLWVLGRSIPRALRLFPAAEAEARNFPREYRILLGLRTPGPSLILESDGAGGLYRTPEKETAPDLEIRFTSTEAAFRLFTFRRVPLPARPEDDSLLKEALPWFFRLSALSTQWRYCFCPNSLHSGQLNGGKNRTSFFSDDLLSTSA